MAKAIEVEGLRELNRAIRKATDQTLRRRVGAANKKIGQLVITRLRPRPVPEAVGMGGGAQVRASAAMREVLLRAGGSHRVRPPMQQWGRVAVSSFGPKPKRPFILGTAEAHRRQIETEYMDALAEAMAPAFWKVET
ncbi:MAG TPA: hypothetical protein VF377_10500 [Acidimicrobiia bacterium]